MVDQMQHRDFFSTGRSVAVSRNGMAATSHPLATLTAIDVLKAGGNAVDAAVSAVAVQSVVDPMMTGIGGDCFALYSPSGGTPIAINGSGYAPAMANANYYSMKGFQAIPDDSPHAVTVPGAADAWCHLISKYGSLAMDRVLLPAIAAAEQGYVITPRVAADWDRYKARIMAYPDAQNFFLPEGKPVETGAIFKSPALAGTLRKLANEGRKGIYEGEIASELVGLLSSMGGLHEESDFSEFRSFETRPISAAYRDYEVVECPPNGQGIAALLILRILDGFDLKDPRFSEADRIHLLSEATKTAYAMRDAIIADPKNVTVDIDEILGEKTVEKLRSSISMQKAGRSHRWDGPDHRDTVSIAVVDSYGNAISLINSIFFAFGSGIYAPRSGILLQNRGSGFVLDRAHPNCIGPRKRPLHTIIPGMLRKAGQTVMTFGVMGGQYQAVGHAHLVSQILDRSMDPQQASDHPRSFWFDGVLNLEPTIGEDVKQELERRGHKVAWAEEPIGGAQAILIDHGTGILSGGSDHRKDGIALGY